MESRFGRDLGHVRVHTGAQAEESARRLGAQAYTVGADAVFGTGYYAPGTAPGQHLLAHELAHTLQSGATMTGTALRISDPADPAEREAHRSATDVDTGRRPRLSVTRSPRVIYRQPLAGELRGPTLGIPNLSITRRYEAEPPPVCDKTFDCAATATGQFAQQPEALRALLQRSFELPDEWWMSLSSDLRTSLASIFNRFCAFGLLCHIHAIVKAEAGEAPVWDTFTVPGKTPSVVFITSSGDRLREALVDSGHFCQASGLGASQHPGQDTLREISGSDSMHVSIGPGNRFDVHIDRYSPTPTHTGSRFCSNDPTTAAVAHVTNELIPEKIRRWKYLRLPGVQVLPLQTPTPRAVPPGSEPTPELIRMTWSTSYSKIRKPPPYIPLPASVLSQVTQGVAARVAADALVPTGVKAAATSDLLDSYADAHVFAEEIAWKMVLAKEGGHQHIEVHLGGLYAALSAADRKHVLDQMRHIAQLVRALLGGRAGDVQKLQVRFDDPRAKKPATWIDF